MKMVYQAEDGTIFDSEVDCIRYETCGFQMFNGFGKRTNNISAAKYVFLRTPEEVDLFVKILSKTKVSTAEFTTPGLYMYTAVGWDHFMLVAGNSVFKNIIQDIQEKDRA